MNDADRSPSILITGATGMIGSLLVDSLVARGTRFAAMVRATDKAAELATKPGVTLVTGDFDDGASLARALTGVERAFLVTNSSEKTEAQQRRFVDAAATAGVRRIVKLSQLAARADSPVRFLRYHAAVEESIRRSGIAWTFVRPNLILQAYLAFARQIAGGVLRAPIGDARVSVVDARDIASVAAAALLDRQLEGRTLTVTGPTAVTHPELADAFGRAIGRPVRFETVSPDAFGAALEGVGMPTWQAEGLVEDYAHYDRGEAAAVSPDVRDVTGAAPRGVDDFARDHASALGKDAPQS